VPAAVVTTDFFQTLGVTAVSGRTFAADDTGGRAVAIVSHGYVQRHFGTDTTALGRSLWINGRQHVIIGVMAADVRFPTTVDLWLPPRHVIPEYPLDPSADPTRNRGSHYLGVVARLHRGATRESAQLEQRAIFHRLIAQYPKEMVAEDANVQLLPVRDWLTGDLSSGLLILLCAVAVVLLLACAYVANLMFARASARAHELAVRTALGASAAAITRQIVTESVMLAAAGGTMGLLASRWVLPTLIAFSPSDVQNVQPVVTAPVALFSVLISGVAALLCSVPPAVQSMRLGRSPLIRRQHGMAATPHGAWRRNLLVAAQCAASVTLLILSALLLRSFVALRHVDPGFRPDGLYTARIVLPPNRYDTPGAQGQFFDRVIEAIRSAPGTAAVAASARLPFIDGDSIRGVILTRPTPNINPEAGIRVVSANYFEVMQQPVRLGRSFSEHDRDTALPVAIVNDAFARRYWRGEDPVGQQLRIASGGPWLRVIGVVSDVKHASLRDPSAPEFYVPYSQMPWNFMTVVVRTNTPLSTVGANITAAISAVDPLLPATSVRPMRDLIATSLAMDAFETAGLSAFAAIGLSLAVLGIYGLMSYTVSRRTAEFALRIAIGAAPRSIATLVLLDAGRVVAVGMMIGACAAVLASRVIRASLFGVAPLDPLTFALVILIVAGVGIGAAYVPARRAMRVNPARAMAVD